MLRFQWPLSTVPHSSRWTDPPPIHPNGVPMERGARLHTLLLPVKEPPFQVPLTGRLAPCQAPQQRDIPVLWALLPISVPVTLPLLPTALILSRGHSYKVPWNWRPSLWLTKLCSMQHVLTVTSQKSGQTSVARWKILHLLHTMPNVHKNNLLARVNQ